MSVKINQNFRIWRGNDLTLNSTVKDENSSALNITGAVIRWKMAEDIYSTAIAISKTSTAGSSEIEITDSTAGQISITLRSTDTRNVKTGVYYHEIELEAGSGDKFTVAAGFATVERSLI